MGAYVKTSIVSGSDNYVQAEPCTAEQCKRILDELCPVVKPTGGSVLAPRRNKSDRKRNRSERWR